MIFRNLIFFLIYFFSFEAFGADSDTLFPYSMPWDDVSANFTNISGWNEKPAGRGGFVTVRDEHLFANGKRLRLFGCNVVFGSAMPTHAEADGIARRMARFGFNIVRLHHMDTRSVPDGLLNADMRTINPGQLDKLDYFISALKRVGIYVDLNLHVGRTYPGFSQWFDLSGNIEPNVWKGVDIFYPPMIEMQHEYARAILSHLNPYTGIRYADEPAVALVEINNEDGLISEWKKGSLDRMNDQIRAELQSRWIAWLREHYHDNAMLERSWGARNVPLGGEMLRALSSQDSARTGWTLQVAAKALAQLAVEDKGIVRLSVSQVDGEHWHVQLHQSGIRLKAGEPYTLTLRLRADRPLHLRLMATQAYDPYKPAWQAHLDVNSEWRDYTFVFSPAFAEDNARLTLSELGAQVGTVWLANSSLKQGGTIGLSGGESLDMGSIKLTSSSEFDGGTLQRQRDWLQFLWDVELGYWVDMRKYLKDILGVKSLVIGTQVNFSPGQIQSNLDVVDAHAYWNHPQFFEKKWDPKNWSVGNSPMAGVDGGGVLAELAMRRVPGKPFVVTEYNHPAPNQYAAESFPLLAAYGALQDWDGIFVYSYGSHNGNWNPGYIYNYFDIHADPNKMSSLVAAAALFRRGDVGTSGVVQHSLPSHARIIEALRTRDVMPGADTLGASRNSAVRSVVSLASFSGESVPALPIRSDTGELIWGVDRSKTVSINTPRSKGIVGEKLSSAFDADGVSFQILSAAKNSGVLIATLMDGQTFRGPGHVLITALGIEENTGQVWESSAHTSVGNNWGGPPVRVEGIGARVTFPIQASRVSAWALDERGKRRTLLPVSGADQSVIEIGSRYESLWYEVEIR